MLFFGAGEWRFALFACPVCISSFIRMALIKSHRELRVYQSAMNAAVHALDLADRFPAEEKFGWRLQVHKSAPSVCANTAEAFRKRRYKPAFVAKLTDAEAEAAETQVWMELAWRQGHITEAEFNEIFAEYEIVLGQLISFEINTPNWKDRTLRLLLITPLALAPFLILAVLLGR